VTVVPEKPCAPLKIGMIINFIVAETRLKSCKSCQTEVLPVFKSIADDFGEEIDG
jgi:hypothetical protein